MTEFGMDIFPSLNKHGQSSKGFQKKDVTQYDFNATIMFSDELTRAYLDCSVTYTMNKVIECYMINNNITKHTYQSVQRHIKRNPDY